MEGISGGLEKFGKLVGEAVEGSETAKASLKRLGVKLVEALSDLEGAFSKAVKTIYEADTGATQIKLSTEAFSKAGVNLMPVINQMNGDLVAFKKAAEEAGKTLTDADVVAADEFGDTLVELSDQLKTTSTQVLLEFAPDISAGMEKVSDALAENKDDVLEWASETRLAIVGLIGYWEDLTGGLKNTANKVQRLFSKKQIDFYSAMLPPKRTKNIR